MPMISDIPINNSSVFTCAGRMKSLTMHIFFMAKQEKTGRSPFWSNIFHSRKSNKKLFWEDSSFGPLVPLIKMAGNLMSYKLKRHSQSHVMGFKSIVSNVKKGLNILCLPRHKFLTTTYEQPSKSPWQIHHFSDQIPLPSPTWPTPRKSREPPIWLSGKLG